MGPGGQSPSLIQLFASEEEAEHALFLSYLHHLESGCDNPVVYHSPEDTKAALKKEVEE